MCVYPGLSKFGRQLMLAPGYLPQSVQCCLVLILDLHSFNLASAASLTGIGEPADIALFGNISLAGT